MIEVQHISKSFGSRKILDDLSLKIQPGCIVFILGLSGTGKSVLLKTLVGLLKPDKGHIFVGPHALHLLSEAELSEVRKMCGMVFQQPALFDDVSVFENVAYGLRRLEEFTEAQVATRVSESLELVGLRGIEGRSPSTLSFGMKKRVSLARTIALKPEVLLFDEPTTGLDPIATTQVNELILSLSRKLGTTSLVVSHDMESALKLADLIVVLDGGKVLVEGAPKQLMQSREPLVQDFLAEVEL